MYECYCQKTLKLSDSETCMTHNCYIGKDLHSGKDSYLLGSFFLYDEWLVCPICLGDKEVSYELPRKPDFLLLNFSRNLNIEKEIKQFRIKNARYYTRILFKKSLNSRLAFINNRPLDINAVKWPEELLEKHNIFPKQKYKYWHFE